MINEMRQHVRRPPQDGGSDGLRGWTYMGHQGSPMPVRVSHEVRIRPYPGREARRCQRRSSRASDRELASSVRMAMRPGPTGSPGSMSISLTASECQRRLTARVFETSVSLASTPNSRQHPSVSTSRRQGRPGLEAHRQRHPTNLTLSERQRKLIARTSRAYRLADKR